MFISLISSAGQEKTVPFGHGREQQGRREIVIEDYDTPKMKELAAASFKARSRRVGGQMACRSPMERARGRGSLAHWPLVSGGGNRHHRGRGNVRPAGVV
jgi:hypothetical protein